MHHAWGLVSPFSKMAVMFFRECLCQKLNFHRTSLLLWSVHVCALLPGCHWPLWRLVWNNWKLLTQVSLFNGARRLYHCDVTASLGPRSEKCWYPKRNLRQLIVTKHRPCVIYNLKAWISHPAGKFMCLIWYNPCDCSYWSTEGVTMPNRYPRTRW